MLIILKCQLIRLVTNEVVTKCQQSNQLRNDVTSVSEKLGNFQGWKNVPKYFRTCIMASQKRVCTGIVRIVQKKNNILFVTHGIKKQNV